VTGSVARGLADERSDIEVNLWTDGTDVPPAADRLAWLAGLGVEDLRADPAPMPDRSAWVTFRWRGIWVEAGWQRAADLDEALDAVLAVRAGDHAHLVMAWTMSGALALRDSGWIAEWKRRLAVYPPGLAERIIGANTAVLGHPQFLLVREALIARGEAFAFTAPDMGPVQRAALPLREQPHVGSGLEVAARGRRGHARVAARPRFADRCGLLRA
jgi:hypothetical protein